METIKWEQGQHSMPVALKARDLGAFVNTTKQKMGGTTNNRMSEAMTDILNIERLPRPKPVLARMIATKALAKAFYGSEATQPRKKDITAIAAACANAAVGKSKHNVHPKSLQHSLQEGGWKLKLSCWCDGGCS